MSKKDKEYLVIDLEMTCEKPRPKGYKPEITEIGIIKINLNGEITGKEQIFVNPKYNPISDYCTELTGHTKDFLKKTGVPFQDACNKLKKLGSKNKKIIAWGEDWLQFDLECEWKGVENPLSGQYLNLSMLHSMIHKTSNKMALEDAIDYYNIDKVGELHSGLDDAYNTALIFKKIMEKFDI